VITYNYGTRGSAITRNYQGHIYNLSYDEENRLASVSGTISASFKYEGDGVRVQATIAGVATAYVGNYPSTSIGTYFEWTSSASTMVKYFYANVQRIAMAPRQAPTASGSSPTTWAAQRSLPTALCRNTVNCATKPGARSVTHGERRPPITVTPGSGSMMSLAGTTAYTFTTPAGTTRRRAGSSKWIRSCPIPDTPVHRIDMRTL